MRFLVDEVDRRAASASETLTLLSVSIHRGVIPRAEMTARESRADDFANYKRVAPGDIVINRMRAFEGGAGVSAYGGMVSSDYAVLRTSPQLDPRFFHHLIRSRWFVGEMTARLRGIGNVEAGNVRTPRINVEALGDIEVMLPVPAEQRAIADYLDIETALIDGTLGRRNAVRLLVAEREDAALRSMVMSAPGPERPLSVLASYVNGFPFQPDEFTLTGLPVVRIRQLVDPDESPDLFDGWVPDRVRLSDGDLVFSWSASLEVRIWDRGPAILNQHLFRVKPALGIERDWLRWVLHIARSDFGELRHGSTMTHITKPMMRVVRVPVPDVGAQLHIALVANLLHQRSTSLLEALDRQIDLLHERRQAIITAAVTGQLEIPGVAA